MPEHDYQLPHADGACRLYKFRLLELKRFRTHDARNACPVDEC